ncbi:MAG: ketopantoate reductase family protein [Planctomycetaceae bacterium]|nr:ketopantoate reductase family protein [Planctomycetaceae bacterium]
MVTDTPIRSVALIGLGAMGTAYFGKFSDILPPDTIQVIADPARVDRYRRDGVRLNGCRFDVPAVTAEAARPADLLIFTVKYHHLAEAVELARNAVGPDTVIISLLNDITSEDVIAEAYGREKVLYSLTIGIDATRTGNDTTVSVYGIIPFGEARNESGRYSRNVIRLAEFFQRAGLDYEIPDDMLRSLWNKFMLNVGVNQTSAVLGGGYRLLQRGGVARGIVRDAMREAAAAARLEGIDLSEKDIDKALGFVDILSPDGKCSMLQDMEAGRPTEVDIFGGTVLALADKHGLDAPVNRMLVRLIKAREESFRR